MATTQKTTSLSESAIVTHHAHQSTVTLMTAKTDGMSSEDWEVDEKKTFSGEGHKRRALGFAYDNSEEGYSEITIDNQAKKAALRRAVADADYHEEAADALAEYLGYLGLSTEEPEVACEGSRADVVWEGGPFEWAKDFASGALIGSSALGSPTRGNFHNERLFSNPNFRVEAKNSYTVSFFAEL